MEVRQYPDERRPFGTIELLPAQHDVHEGCAQLHLKGQSVGVCPRRNVRSAEAAETFARSPGPFCGHILEPWIGREAPQKKCLDPLVRPALLSNAVLHGPDIGFAQLRSRDSGARAIFMAMPEEEPLGRAARQINRNTARRAHQACVVTFDERLESLA